LRAILARMEEVFPKDSPKWTPTATLQPGAIPILGRTAAGLLASWDDFFAGHDDPQILDRLIRRVEAAGALQRGGKLESADASAESRQPTDAAAMVVQLSQPTPDGIVEYLELPGIEPIGPGAFALRVDGDSMAPRIRDGDLIVCRRGMAPEAGQTAVVRIRGRVGLTVKLWRPEGDHVHLIPINEAYQPSRLPRSQILWACRVLWVVRL